jgi:hypothetical protein
MVNPQRDGIIGAVRAVNCSFVDCHFSRLGLALTQEAAREFGHALEETRRAGAISENEPETTRVPSAGEPVAG